MKNLCKSLATGMVLLGACHGVQANDTNPGTYSDRQLTPTTQPPYPTAPKGNDLLLAENVGGGGPPTYPYNVTVDPTSWKTAFFVGAPGGYGNFDSSGSADCTGGSGFSFTGAGPTGVYPNAGAGKHTQFTPDLLKKVVVLPGHTWAYQYVVTYTTHSWYNNRGTDATANLGVNTYNFDAQGNIK